MDNTQAGAARAIFKTFAVSTLFLLLPEYASANLISFAGFTFEANGCAALAGASLRIQSNSSAGCADPGVIFPNGNMRGSAFLDTATTLNSDSSWNVAFSYRVTGTGDGFVFTVQNDTRGSAALAGGGENLGYYYPPASGGIQPSAAFEFDVFQNPYDPDSNHIGYAENGPPQTPSLETATPGYDINDGAEHFVWIDYNGLTDELALFTASSFIKPGTALLNRTVDLPSLLGGQGYFGFTAATGAARANFDITGFSFSIQDHADPVPEPPLIALMAFASVALISRFRPQAPTA